MIMIKNFTSQNDPRWAELKIGGKYTWGGKNAYACLSHCLLHFAAHVGLIENPDPREWLHTLHSNRVIDPNTGLSPSGGMWATRFMPFGLSVDGWSKNTPSSRSKAIAYLTRGKPIFAMVDSNPSTVALDQHWILIVGADGSDVQQWRMADPWTGKIERVGNRYKSILEFVFIDSLLPITPYERAIDLSQYQNIARYNFYGIRYAYVRASYGGTADILYTTHTKALSDQNVDFSAYHYLLPDSVVSIAEQVKKFLSQIVSSRQPTKMAVVDFEGKNFHDAPSAEDLRRFIERYEADTGEVIAIYSRANLLSSVPLSVLGDRPILQAHYTVAQSPLPLPYGLKPAIWQFSETGRIHWHDGNVDQNKIIDFNAMAIRRVGDSYIPPVVEPNPEKVDLFPYIFPHFGDIGRPYMMQMSDGRQERYQYQPHPTDKDGLIITKNSQWEYWRLDENGMIRLVRDTSPEPTQSGPCYYEVMGGDNRWGGIMFPRFMTVGETFTEPQTHTVKFRLKSTGAEYGDPRSGINRNENTLISISDDKKVVEIGKVGGEVHFFELGKGRVGWKSPWGSSALSSDGAGEQNNIPEIIAS